MKPNQTLFPTLWVVLLIGHFCLSQTKEIDSLQNLLETADDTTKIRLQLEQSFRLRPIDLEKSLGLTHRTIEKSKEMGYIWGQIHGVYTLALTHGMTSNYVESLNYLKECLDLALEHQDFDTIISTYMTYGIIYKRIGDYPTSQNYYFKSLKLVDSLQLYEDESISKIYVNLGILYGLMDEDDKAIESYNKAIEVHYGDDYEYTEAGILANMAEIDLKKKDFESALEKLLKTTIFYEKNDQTLRLSYIYSKIGVCHLNLKNYTLADEYFLKSLQVAQELNLKQEIAIANFNLANLKLQQNDLESAINYSRSNLEALKVLGEYKYKQEAHALASEIFEEAGQFSKAIYHTKQTIAYQDSLLNETKIKEIQNLQIQHDVYIKDRELKENELQMALLGSEISLNNKRMTYMVIISLLLFFSASLLYIRYRSKKKTNTVLFEKNTLISNQNKIIESMNYKLEKQMLRAQMNPHFIFNSLNSIQSLIHANDRENALNYLCKFSKLLRQVLESSINISLLLSEEIKLLKIYVELEALRFDNSFQYAFHIDENLDVDAHEVPMLLVQPYIENAIIHGLIPKEGEKQLDLYFNDSPEFIECIIEDNGIGMCPNKNKKQGDRISRGMSITEKRIESLKKFTNLELVQIENLNNGTATGTRVTILIPKEV